VPTVWEQGFSLSEQESHALYVKAKEWLRLRVRPRYVRIVKEADVLLKADFLALPVKERG
jgi:hypothetical protein